MHWVYLGTREMHETQKLLCRWFHLRPLVKSRFFWFQQVPAVFCKLSGEAGKIGSLYSARRGTRTIDGVN